MIHKIKNIDRQFVAGSAGSGIARKLKTMRWSEPGRLNKWERGLGAGSDRPCFPFSKTGGNLSSGWIESPAEGLASQVSCLSSSFLCILPSKTGFWPADEH